jgi:hypothetical protein
MASGKVVLGVSAVASGPSRSFVVLVVIGRILASSR